MIRKPPAVELAGVDGEMKFRMQDLDVLGWHAPWCRLVPLKTIALVFYDREDPPPWPPEDESCSCGFTAWVNAEYAVKYGEPWPGSLRADRNVRIPSVEVWEDDGGPEYNPQRVQTMNYDDI